MRIPYGTDWLVRFPLVTSGADTFLSSATIAAGDIKVGHDELIHTNPSGETVAFTSGSEQPANGDTLTGATSTETCTVMFTVLTSGTWSGGDAAGTLFVTSASGAFQSENLNNTTSGTDNVMTIGGDLDGAGLFVELAGGEYAAAIPAAQLQGKVGSLKIVDAAGGPGWAATTIPFETEGHENAFDPQGCVLTDAVGSATGQTTTNVALSATPASGTIRPGFYMEVVSGTAANSASYVDSITDDDVTLKYALPLALGADSVVKFYRDAPRHPSDVEMWLGAAAATPTNAGVPEVDVTYLVGGLVPTPNTTGTPDVNVKEVNDVTITGDGSGTPFGV